MHDAITTVQRQLDAYNARDMDAWLATYAPDAEQRELTGALLAQGHGQLRERMRERFTEPDLHARLLQRTMMDNVVVDHELITRNFPEGRGQIPLLCLYEVEDGLIRRAWFRLARRLL